MISSSSERLKLDSNRQLGNSGKGTYTWLSGLLKCAKCGYSLKVISDKSHRWLACSGRYNLSRCDASIHVKLSQNGGRESPKPRA